MQLAELLLLSVGLAMDAFAVSVCKGLSLKSVTINHGLICGLWFGSFQGLMPFLGFILGSGFTSIIDRFAAWIAFAILTVIGINMIREGLSSEEEELEADMGFKAMFPAAVATSIDALAVGLTFVAMPVNVLDSSIVINTLFGCICIAVITFIISCAGTLIGSTFGSRYRSKAVMLGGAILIILGIKALLDKYGLIK